MSQFLNGCFIKGHPSRQCEHEKMLEAGWLCSSGTGAHTESQNENIHNSKTWWKSITLLLAEMKLITNNRNHSGLWKIPISVIRAGLFFWNWNAHPLTLMGKYTCCIHTVDSVLNSDLKKWTNILQTTSQMSLTNTILSQKKMAKGKRIKANLYRKEQNMLWGPSSRRWQGWNFWNAALNSLELDLCVDSPMKMCIQ